MVVFHKIKFYMTRVLVVIMQNNYYKTSLKCKTIKQVITKHGGLTKLLTRKSND